LVGTGVVGVNPPSELGWGTRLLANPKEKIDTSDIPELPADAWKNAVRGRFYRPLKEAVNDERNELRSG
jgi:hypothetical protein